MRKLTWMACCVIALTACKENKGSDLSARAESDAAAEAADIPEDTSGWEVLFDGSSFDGWKGYNQEGMPENWTIEDGAMVFTPPTDRPDGESYNLVTQNKYMNFVLSLEWQISEGGNSGVFWGVEEMEKFGQPYQTGPEIQVLDNERHPDAKAGTTHQAGALYDMVAPAEDATRPAGEWNTMEITIDYEGEMGKVVLNGTELLTFPLGNEAWDAMVADSKFAGWEGFGQYPHGRIGLQDHGDRVAFRNIKIKQL